MAGTRKRRVFLGLGSNVGERRAMLAEAVNALAAHPAILLEEIHSSSLYESPALLPENAPGAWDQPFFNCVVMGMTTADAETLLVAVKQIEQALGRQARGHWGPREIDIDILMLGDERVQEPHLIIPHPEMSKRDFVMVPLAEIAPELLVNGEPARSIAARLIVSSTIKQVA